MLQNEWNLLTTIQLARNGINLLIIMNVSVMILLADYLVGWPNNGIYSI